LKSVFHNIFKGTEAKEPFDFKTNVYVKIFIGIVTISIVILLLPSYKTIETEFEVGTIWSSEDLIAPFPFPIYKDKIAYEKEKKDVMRSVAPVFIEVNVAGDINDSLNNFFKSIDGILTDAKKLEEINEGGIDSDVLLKRKNLLKIQLDDGQWRQLYNYYKNELTDASSFTYPSLKEFLLQNLTESNRNKIINLERSKITSKKITIKREKEKLQDIDDINNVYDRNQIMKILTEKIQPLVQDSILKTIVFDITKAFVKENLYFDKPLTDLEIQNRIAQIPKTVGIVRENERIISKHDPITRNTKLKLDSYKRVRLEKIGVQDYFLQYLGKVLTVVILLTMLALFLFYIRKRVYNDNYKLTLISSLLIMQCFIAFLSLRLNVNYPVELLIFVSVASILLTILFDSRLAFYTTVIICFLVAAVRGGDYTIAFTSLSGSILAIFSVRDIKNRSQIFRSFFFILGGYTISILAFGLDRTEGTQKILTQLMFGSINAVLSPVLAYWSFNILCKEFLE